MRLLLTVPLLALATGALAGERLLEHATIRTLDPARPTAEAMVWDEHGRIVELGDAATLRSRHPDAERVDGAGATVIPGLIDAHGHVMGLGFSLMRADLAGADSIDAVIARLQAFAKELPPGAWLLGRGWDQNRWPGKRFPTRAVLDAAFPERPVWLTRVDGHAGWANSAALAAVGRDLAGDWQPAGGRIVRDADGQPTGVLVDAATDLVDAVVPAPSEPVREQALQRALDAAVAVGLTGVHDMGVSLDDLALYRRFADAGRLPLRITAYADGEHAALTALCTFGPLEHPGGRLRMRGVKLYADGALGSRGAMLLADYADDPHNRGLPVTSAVDLERAMRTAARCGLQVATHAIGDAGNREVLDLYQRVLGDRADGDHRWRIEHAQIVALDDIARFAALHVVASMQPTHATSDMPWAADRLGAERLAGAYAWQRFLQAGVRLPFGSDFPVESVDPRLGLYAAVTRQDADGNPPGGWLPEQRVSLAQALAGFTTEAAWAGFAEDQVGRLAPGLRADFLLLDADPLLIDAQALRRLPIRSTWVDGRPVWQRPATP